MNQSIDVGRIAIIVAQSFMGLATFLIILPGVFNDTRHHLWLVLRWFSFFTITQGFIAISTDVNIPQSAINITLIYYLTPVFISAVITVFQVRSDWQPRKKRHNQDQDDNPPQNQDDPQ